MADGGLRFTFDVPETEVLAAAQLMECKRWGVTGNVTYQPVEQAGAGNAEDGHELAARRKRQSGRKAAQKARPHGHVVTGRGRDGNGQRETDGRPPLAGAGLVGAGDDGAE